MDNSTNLKLPYIAAAQALKHITHNEAIRALDAIVQLSVLDQNLTAPPASPVDGDRYIAAASSTGPWAGKDNQIAAWQDSAWMFYAPLEGWLVWVANEDQLYVWSGTVWAKISDSDLQNIPMLGVNAIADTTNRLSLSAPATLFTHEGAGHQLKINKNAAGDTASFLFQTNWSGRAEFGTTGDDKFHIKVSTDGSSWNEAITIDPATNWVGIGTANPEGPLHILRGLKHPLNDRVDDNPAAAVYMCRKARGTPAAKTALIQGDVPQAFYGVGYDGSAYIGAANLRWIIDGPVSAGNIPTMVEFWTFTSGVGLSKKLEITNGGTTRPSADNAYSLGDASYRWASVWAANGTIQTSDKRDKVVVGDLAFAGCMVDAIDPVLFKWKSGGNEVVASKTETEIDEAGDEVPVMETVSRHGKRPHAGFLAQDVKAAMDNMDIDFAAWGLEDTKDKDSKQWLRPDQLISVMWAALKETREEVERLKNG